MEIQHAGRQRSISLEASGVDTQDCAAWRKVIFDDKVNNTKHHFAGINKVERDGMVPVKCINKINQLTALFCITSEMVTAHYPVILIYPAA